MVFSELHDDPARRVDVKRAQFVVDAVDQAGFGSYKRNNSTY
jgi:hypothetical protein